MTPTPNAALDWATNDDSLETLLTNVDKKEGDISGPMSLLARAMGSLVIHALLLVLVSLFFSLWISSIETSCPLDPLRTYSPVNEAVSYVEKQFDGGVNSTNIYRGDPSPELDAAWVGISVGVKATRLTMEQFLMSGGNNTAAAIKYRPEDGGGYMSQVDGYHHLHCLDLLRMYLRRDYYAPFDLAFNDKLRPHLGHCVEILRQKLMCTSDLTMVTYDWVPGLNDPQTDLHAVHQCMDYDRILAWSEKHNAHVLSGHVVKFGDAKKLSESENPM